MAEHVEKLGLIATCKEIAANSWNQKAAPVSWSDAYEHFADMLEESSAADVVEVKHGRWVPREPDSDIIFFCSRCDTEISTSWDYDQPEMWNYCPHCGARMDGE